MALLSGASKEKTKGAVLKNISRQKKYNPCFCNILNEKNIGWPYVSTKKKWKKWPVALAQW
jgi:hypothetical protein